MLAIGQAWQARSDRVLGQGSMTKWSDAVFLMCCKWIVPSGFILFLPSLSCA